MTTKQIDELVKVRNGEPYTKRHDFWASLCRASIVEAVHKPNHSIEKVEITKWGKIVLDNALKGTE